MNLIVTNIEWETNGKKPVKDCSLPKAILVLNAPEDFNSEVDEMEEDLSERISSVYGFCFAGYTVLPCGTDQSGKRILWGKRLAVTTWNPSE